MPHTLLLADDSVTIQRVIELTFAEEDVQVVAVSDGDQAIERLESAPPDIVLADIGMAGVALAEGIGEATGLEVSLKWPNDLFVARRKLGGILAESSGTAGSIDAVTVGYGINVSATAFPRELSDRATSLESELGREVDRSHVLAETLAALAERYDDLLAGRFDAILDRWRAKAATSSGAFVSWTTADGVVSGQTVGIDLDGALLVRRGDAIERIVAGEVNWMDR